MMRLANGIVLDKDTTFGELKFSALRREVRIQNEDGSVSDEIKERTYDLKSKGQGRMIQVSIPASVPLKEFDYNARVELINPIADTVATATYQGADVDWYIKADDIVKIWCHAEILCCILYNWSNIICSNGKLNTLGSQALHCFQHAIKECNHIKTLRDIELTVTC